MTEFLFLVYAPDFFGVQGTLAWLYNTHGQLVRNTLPDGGISSPIVTYDAPTLLDEYRKRKTSLPTQIVDIGEALRLISGRARDEGAERSWNAYKALPSFSDNSSAVKTFCNIALGREPRPDDSTLKSLSKAASVALSAMWRETSSTLKEAGESERFWTVEVPFSQVCWYRQWKGIRINKERVSAALDAARQEKYQAYVSIAQRTNTSPSGASYRTIRDILHGTELSFLLENPATANLENELKLAADRFLLARDIVQYLRALRDEGVLSRMAGPVETVFPAFQPIGTVTGRTLVADPHLQNIRRKFRVVVEAAPGKRLAYLDYAQFEPGIAAYLSKDYTLMHDYNNGDVYKKLSFDVYGSDEKRSVAKRAFISFLYGMSESSIGKLLSDNTSSREDSARRVAAFFDRYQGLRKFRDANQNQLAEKGFIATELGNARRRIRKGSLDSKERRWATNQRVQGTASLILKEAMLSMGAALGVDSLLLPIHDAVLIEVDDSNFNESVAQAKILMSKAFKDRCPDIEVAVSVSQFDSQ